MSASSTGLSIWWRANARGSGVRSAARTLSHRQALRMAMIGCELSDADMGGAQSAF
jgi:hypothetical protein